MDIQERIKQLAEEHPDWSARKIGEIVGKSKTTVISYYHKLGIIRDRLTMQKLNNTSRDNPIIITSNAEQIILGSILGDGSITKYKRSDENTKLRLNSMLNFVNGERQLPYFNYKKDLLLKEGINGRVTEIPPINGTRKIKGIALYTKTSYSYYTRRNSSFNKYRELFYKDKKYVNEYIFKLGPLGLAIWYLDDGNKDHNIVRIYTNCFNDEDLVILQEMLMRNFNIKTRLNKTSNVGKAINILRESQQHFFEIIRPFVPECMYYKIDT